jgi:hypothetical protein
MNQDIYISGIIHWSQKHQSPYPANYFGWQSGSFQPVICLHKIRIAVVGRKLTFEPELQVSLEGKPWSLFLWVRHKLVNNSRFFCALGTSGIVIRHPADFHRPIERDHLCRTSSGGRIHAQLFSDKAYQCLAVLLVWAWF